MTAIRTIAILTASLVMIGVAEAQKGGGKPGGGGGGGKKTTYKVTEIVPPQELLSNCLVGFQVVIAPVAITEGGSVAASVDCYMVANNNVGAEKKLAGSFVWTPTDGATTLLNPIDSDLAVRVLDINENGDVLGQSDVGDEFACENLTYYGAQKTFINRDGNGEYLKTFSCEDVDRELKIFGSFTTARFFDGENIFYQYDAYDPFDYENPTPFSLVNFRIYQNQEEPAWGTSGDLIDVNDSGIAIFTAYESGWGSDHLGVDVVYADNTFVRIPNDELPINARAIKNCESVDCEVVNILASVGRTSKIYEISRIGTGSAISTKDLPAIGYFSLGSDINDNGVIVGRYTTEPNFNIENTRAAKWQANTIIDLNESVPRKIDALLTHARKITNKGQILSIGVRTNEGDQSCTYRRPGVFPFEYEIVPCKSRAAYLLTPR